MTNTLNRRSMLRATLIGTGAILSTAAVACSAAPAFAFADAAQEENPELLALGKSIPALEAEYIAARRARAAVVAKWSKRWPSAPAAIVKPWQDQRAWERDFEGFPILSDGSRYRSPEGLAFYEPHTTPRPLLVVDDLERQIAELDRTLIRRRPKHPLTAEVIAEIEAEITDLPAKLAVAREYEAAKVQVTKASGLAAATARQNAARDALAAAVKAAMATPETSMAGVLIKARSVQAWGSMHTSDQFDFVAMMKWPGQLAAAVLRHAA